MLEGIVNKRNVIVFLLVVLVFVTLSWLLVPRLIKLCKPYLGKEEVLQELKKEGFNQEEQLSKPNIEVKTGTIVDGPGFERGEVDGVSQESLSTIPSNYYFIDDGADGAMSIQHNLCSKSCCSAQWPTPFKQKYDPYVCGNKSKYVPTNIMCNNAFNDSGCACVTKEQAQFLYNRGTNGREWF